MVSPDAEGVLLSRLEVARQLYNACLKEALRRVNLIRQSKNFNKARSLKASNPERKALFKRTRERYDFSEYAIHSYSTQLRHSWLGDHIDSNTTQKIATRAYKAVEKVLFGKAKNFGRCPEVEWVAAEVLTNVPKIQDAVGESREPGRGHDYPARRSPKSS